MHIRLLRRGSRALILPAGAVLDGCPLPVQAWLGAGSVEAVAELTPNTPCVGLDCEAVLAALRDVGYCALDLDGIVAGFSMTAVEAAARADASASAMDFSATVCYAPQRHRPETRVVKPE